MARFKAVDRSPRFLPIDLEAQLIPGSFEHALDYLVDHELDLRPLHAKYRNDATGAPAYEPSVLLKIVLLAYSRGMISSRRIERACRENVLFMALSGDSAPQFTTLAKFIRDLGDDIGKLFTQVLMTCDAQGLIGRQMFAIDGVKLPGNASKRRSGTHAELAKDAERMEQAVKAMVKAHRQRDVQGEAADSAGAEEKRRERLQREAARIRDFLAREEERKSAKGNIRKSNVTDNDSAKMATSKGVLQGFTAVAAVDDRHQIIVAARAHGSGSEQDTLLPVVKQTEAVRTDQTLVTADAGYHSEVNLAALYEAGVPALIADPMMRKRDERFKDQGKYKALPDPLYDKGKSARDADQNKRFRPTDFTYDANAGTCICPAGKSLYSHRAETTFKGRTSHRFRGQTMDCGPCTLRAQCLRYPDRTPVRQVAFFHKNQPSALPFTERMKQAIDSPQGRQLYGRRMATVEPVFGNLRHNKGLNRFTLRGQKKVNTQWHLYCLVHNIEKLAHHGYAQ